MRDQTVAAWLADLPSQAPAGGRAATLTPVPGGVGPVTTMLLMRHTALAARLAASSARHP